MAKIGEAPRGTRGLSFAIAVDGMKTATTDAKGYTRIGTIRFTDSVASEGCDYNLHFAHPKWLH